MQHADRPARIEEPDSETPYATTRAIEFIEQAGDAPWCLHLSYIKPHWPYIVPSPYHDLYGRDDVLPAVRSEAERENAHPVLAAYHEHRFSKVFCRDEVRERVIPAYMGLITQIDDQIGRLVAYLEESGRADDTMIVFTSDHGDYLGDHWLGEKELFHEPSVRVPLIVADPSEAADATRGTASRALVEGIDLVPTFVEAAGGRPRREVIEGHSLRPLLHGTRERLRDQVISEYDYSFRAARALLGQPVEAARLVMIFDGRFKLIEAEGFRPMLYDLETDPDELHDLGADPAAHAGERERLKGALDRWYRRHHTRTTISDEDDPRPRRAGRSTAASSSASGTRRSSPRRSARAAPETDRPDPRRARRRASEAGQGDRCVTRGGSSPPCTDPSRGITLDRTGQRPGIRKTWVRKMASFVSRFLKGLTGGSSSGDGPAERGEAVAYKDLVIYPAPVREGQQWRIAGVILKQGGDGELERTFTRADTVATREEAETLSVSKARQIIDQRGADLFADGEPTGYA